MYNTDISWFKEQLQNKSLIERLKKIKLIISDIDGCQTNGNVYGINETKGYCVQDGFGTTQALKSGLHIAFISGKLNADAKKRSEILGIPKELCHLGIGKNKINKVHEVQKLTNTSKDETLYFGDDFLDIETKEAIEIFTSPKNAIFYIQSQAEIITPRVGGNGAFRILLDLILYIQNKHFAQELIEKTLRND